MLDSISSRYVGYLARYGKRALPVKPVNNDTVSGRSICDDDSVSLTYI